jgi:hypothetical protein
MQCRGHKAERSTLVARADACLVIGRRLREPGSLLSASVHFVMSPIGVAGRAPGILPIMGSSHKGMDFG